ncbi:glycosyltransferase family 4 protein [Oleiagrimonas sp. C23AA]|uniref:glycosyltransferase family 4 protein n=1 Tax=Oleiagrimonas sp. C23AA TaxID=2719047 RepID=UPI0014216632|nr:glycosyltransferase family 4 protein [Oleiagrimonas sp. C23AA]NII10826.1 glycosyltransferase family 4 protein [Oleiagrimonas sp. C23AA]
MYMRRRDGGLRTRILVDHIARVRDPAFMPTVQLLARDNGFGLSRSLRLVADALRKHGHDVVINGQDEACGRRRRLAATRVAVSFRSGLKSLNRILPRYDANIMLEHIWPQGLHEASRNIYMPNPEWVDRHDLRYLPRMDAVFGKTHDTVRIFREMGVTSSYVGFASEDRLDETVTRDRRFFHLAGGAYIKGTERLLSLWRKHPEWPLLTVLQDPSRARPGPTARNIAHRIEYLDLNDPVQRREMSRLQNSHLFHLCPSETDGWGHYMAEAMGVGALVLSVDAPPMNEMVTTDRGLLINYHRSGRRRLATTYFFDEQALEKAVDGALSMPEEEMKKKREAARHWFEQMCASFPQRLHDAIVSAVA